ncbi:MAG: DegT/DnrJ/EryC1/StrS family aminotransferase [Verrucomicrobia bacterium]|nr:DegT/DnrJ/EryC1/StrS family aminotransferase [Verrucomicrobiota bacterium]
MKRQQSFSGKLAVHGGVPVRKTPVPSFPHGTSEIGEREIRAVVKVLRRKTIFRFLNQPEVSESARLEAAYRKYTGCKHALAIGSGGTTALVSALVGLGVGAGDEVILPGYTYIATAAACIVVNAVPVICEVDHSLTMDPRDLEKKITRHTRAIIPVHMRGTPCRMRKILAVARRHKLKVLEDVAQANGGSYRGAKLGALGDAGAFSFQHYKIITSGEGGMVITNDKTVYQRACLAHDSAMVFWSRGENWLRPFAGENYRMCELRAALGLVQFGRLDWILNRCRAVKRRIVEGIGDLPHIRLQDVPDPDGDCGISLVFYLPDSKRAQTFSEALKREGVPNGTMFNQGIPDRHIYCHWEYVMNKWSRDRLGLPWNRAIYKGNVRYSRDMCPNTLHWLGRAIALHLHQRLTVRDADDIVRAIRKVAVA